MLIKKVLHHVQVKATAGGDTRVVSSDGMLDLKVTMPLQLGGTNERGTNPEQLFAASYATSFLGIMRFVAEREGIAFPTNTEVEASVRVGPALRGFGIEVELKISLPGLPRTEADLLVEQSHAACPYSNAMRSSVPVRLLLV
jgi:osmotically inducible protein OsmC